MTPIDYTLPLDELPDPLPIEPLTKPFDVTITPPGSKSITCRAYVLAALANGESKIIRPLRADDTDLLLKALCTLGAEARWEGDDVFIKGVNGRFPRGGSVNLGDGGTPTRFMIARACLAAEPVVVDGSPRMRERPIAEGVDMLRQLGAKIEYVEQEGRLPVRVVPSESLVGGEIDVPRTQSSQFISAILLIAPMLEQGVLLRYADSITSGSYVNLTRWMMKALGIDINDNGRRGDLAAEWIAPATLQAKEEEIEPDASSAMYWVAAAAVVPGSQIVVCGIAETSCQPDLDAVVYLESAGIYYDSDHVNRRLVIQGPKQFRGMTENASHSPDAALALSIIASRATSTSRLHGLATLRVKETDRLAALANELRKVGCTVETGEDWIEITPAKFNQQSAQRAATVRERGPSESVVPRESAPTASPLPDGRGSLNQFGEPVIIETYNDHRMAMSFAILGLVRPGISIRNPKCVAKSYPGFWKDFAKLYQ